MQFFVALRSSAVPSESPALAAALSLRREGDTVIVFSMGTPKAEPMLKTCTACGADEAYLLSDKDFAGADSHATARALHAFIEKHREGQYLVFTQESDSPYPTMAVPGRLAALLGSEQFYYVESAERDGDSFTCVQDYGDEKRRCSVPSCGSVLFFKTSQVSIPVTCSGKDAVVLDRVALGLGAYSVGKLGSRTAVLPSKGAQ